MKTLIFSLVIPAMITLSSANAFSSNNSLSVNDASGRTLTMPLKTEEALIESLPFDTKGIFEEERQKDLDENIDISKMVKPEAEVNDIPVEVLK